MARGYKGRDRYSRRARDDGYAARSVYKLREIDRRARVLARGQRVLDLGCHPGSWTAYALDRVGRGGVVVGVDPRHTDLGPGRFVEGSVLEVEPGALREALGGPADVVLSDMAPDTTGNRFADHYNQVELAGRALDLAVELLRPGGALVCKVFEGPDAADLQARAREHFGRVRRMRPEAVRKQSREWYLVALRRR